MADVTANSGLICVRADNSSLKQIVREIARLSGMKVTGEATEERVFGSYGPANVDTILAVLLSGSGTNMVLVGGRGKLGRQLILSPRNGNPSPPDRKASSNSASGLPPLQQQNAKGKRPPELFEGSQGPNSSPFPPASGGSPVAGSQGTSTPAVTPSKGDDTKAGTDLDEGPDLVPHPPNGVKTPREIKAQLLQFEHNHHESPDQGLAKDLDAPQQHAKPPETPPPPENDHVVDSLCSTDGY